MSLEVVLPEIDPNADPRSLVDVMDFVLEVIVKRYEQANIDLPERRYWTLGTPAADCEQLVVAFALLYTGAPGDQATEAVRCNSPRSAQMSVEIMRCIPVSGPRGVPPTGEVIQSASEKQAIDAWMLLDTACLCDPWFGGLGVIATVTAGEAQGGYQGVVMTLTVAVP